MTLFVRDNNNGKNCIMTLICELLKIQFHYKQYDFDEKPGNYMRSKQLELDCEKLLYSRKGSIV
ncbi:MAG: hypothetical protein OSJ73_16480 [Lachnospiraceae bacterium]|nr:hypothetical protein [Lachnospiraceae bacterium]